MVRTIGDWIDRLHLLGLVTVALVIAGFLR
jgi:hypothetical protein